jgi:hypothetical protein
MIIRRGANAPTTQDNVSRSKAALISGCQGSTIIGQDFNPGQLQAPRAEKFDHFREMLVLPTSRKDFIANDNKTKARFLCSGRHKHSKKVSNKTNRYFSTNVTRHVTHSGTN